MKSFFLIPALAIFSAIALLIGSLTTANAGHHGHSMFKAGINDMDANGDGVVSFEEYANYHNEKLRWSFNALDSDNDGAISKSEWDQFLKMHGAGKAYGSDQES